MVKQRDVEFSWVRFLMALGTVYKQTHPPDGNDKEIVVKI